MRVQDVWTAYETAPARPDPGDLTLTRYDGHWTRFSSWLASATEYAADLLRAGYGPNTYNKHTSFLRLLFRVLAKPARITENPFSEVTRKTLRTHSRRELTVAELRAILDGATGDMETLLYIGAATGLRLGDCCTLTWGEVDLDRRIIRRIPNKTKKTGKPVLVGIPPALHERLAATPRRTGYVLPDLAESYLRNRGAITRVVKIHIIDCGIDVHAPGTGERIRRGPDGTPERNPAGRVIVEDTGKPAVVDVGFHSLRHTWVSMHAAAGTPGAVIQASVGHASPAMTAHYTHINETTARDVALALPAFAGSTPAARDPLPAWARAIIENSTAETWETVKAELLATTGALR